jgi:hypothetical protein
LIVAMIHTLVYFGSIRYDLFAVGRFQTQ